MPLHRTLRQSKQAIPYAKSYSEIQLSKQQHDDLAILQGSNPYVRKKSG